MNWSPEQDRALLAVDRWLRTNASPLFRLFGFAGTGKTTLAKHLAAGVRGDVLFAAFTGKAASVMRAKGCEDASTIHGLIYRCEEDHKGNPHFFLNPESRARYAGLLVIDECSMVDERVGRDLLSFDRPILVLGDPAQLPPINGSGYFTAAEPDIMLREVHRQARDNPIINLATTVREGRWLRRGNYGASRVLPLGALGDCELLDADQVLVGLNRTRRNYNADFRTWLNLESPAPIRGDRVVCLRNNHAKGLLNGSLWSVQRVLKSTDYSIVMNVEPEDGGQNVEVRTNIRFFTGREKDLGETRKLFDEFDFGYALTVHKAQGSQWNDVVLLDESMAFREDRARWLYTGITRAADRVTVVMGK
jgi:exodeoxyribonuclease-5